MIYHGDIAAFAEHRLDFLLQLRINCARPFDQFQLVHTAQQNAGHVGVYATVLRGGIIRRGDSVRIES